MSLLGKFRAWRSKKMMERELPDFFLMAANGIKAGLALPQALRAAARGSEGELGNAVSRMFGEMERGQTFRQAMERMARRIGLSDLSLMVASVLILQETGGPQGSHLENLSVILRERQQIRRKTELLTAQGRAQGIFLASLPLGLGAALRFLSPEFMQPLFSTSLGRVSCLAILILDAGGFWWLMKSSRVAV